MKRTTVSLCCFSKRNVTRRELTSGELSEELSPREIFTIFLFFLSKYEREKETPEGEEKYFFEKSSQKKRSYQ